MNEMLNLERLRKKLSFAGSKWDLALSNIHNVYNGTSASNKTTILQDVKLVVGEFQKFKDKLTSANSRYAADSMEGILCQDMAIPVLDTLIRETCEKFNIPADEL